MNLTQTREARGTQTLSLNGTWELTYSALDAPENAWGRWIPALVPGDIHLDLKREELIAEPLVGENTKRARWIEGKAWWYRRDFIVPEGFLGSRTELVCDGLDLTAELWVNGQAVGRANNMFVPHRFDVSPYVREGVNEILVRLDVGLEAAEGKPTDLFAKSWGREEPKRPWIRKAQQAFYWDTAPRLLTCGIWRGIRLESFDQIALRDVYITSTFDAVRATVRVEAELTNFSAQRTEVVLECVVQNDERSVNASVSASLAPGDESVRLELNLEQPKLWWPNGMGEQHRYPVTVRVSNREGRMLGETTVLHGIRSIELETAPINEQEKSFTFVVNGCRVFAKGGNWVPSDSVYARTGGARERRLLELARDANFNMIRVWGGGIYPDQEFYDACDEFGLLVWQDFMYACAYYPDFDADFVAAARREAEQVVRGFRNHPSLALWCGNNENFDMHERVDPTGIFYGKDLYLETLPEVCARLDPVTRYHPSSPYPTRWEEGDHHVWDYTLGLYLGQEKAMRLWDYTEINYKFISEFGVFCPSNPSSVRKFMGEFPDVIDSEVYNHHRNHFEANFINLMLQRFYKYRETYEPEEFVVAGQMSQAEVVKFIIEEFRSRMFVCSGTLFWEYNDSWGHVGYAPVDYYLNLKPLYQYMQRAYAPLHAVFRREGRELWVLNDTPRARSLEVEYGLMSFEGEILFVERLALTSPACGKVLVAELEDRLSGLARLDSAFAFARVSENGLEIDRNRQFLVPIKDLNMPASTLQHQIVRTTEASWRVSLTAEHFAWMVKLDSEDDLRYSDNAFDLWPGEHRTVEIFSDQPRSNLRLQVYTVNQFFNS